MAFIVSLVKLMWIHRSKYTHYHSTCIGAWMKEGGFPFEFRNNEGEELIRLFDGFKCTLYFVIDFARGMKPFNYNQCLIQAHLNSI